MQLRVALITLGLTLLVPPPAVAIMWDLRWAGGEAATFAVLARYTVVVALVLAPVFLVPLVWLTFRLREASPVQDFLTSAGRW